MEPNYSHKIKSAPTGHAVSLEEARAWCQYFEESAEMDTLIDFLIASGEEYIEDLTGRPLVSTTYVYKLDCFPREIKLLRAPVTELVHVKYRAEDSGPLLDLTSQLDIDLDSEPARIRPKYGSVYPVLARSYLPIEIEYKAGGSPRSNLLKALRLLVATWFKYREFVIVPTGNNPAELPKNFTVEAMLRSSVLEVFPS